ncbi:MAG: permease DsdX, partial [Candidatus Dormibacteraeota bacterium]|nr:permease DsdX [Candidatus Dormibacteraeota bacterium]
FGMWAMGLRLGTPTAELQRLLGRSVAPAANVILIIGAGSGFKEVLLASHVGDVAAQAATHWHIDPLLLAWSVAALIRIAVGSATVATVTAAGIVAPIASQSGVSPALMVLAASSGGVMMSHLNDSGFWLFKEYFQLSILQTLRSWTFMLCVQSLLGLLGVLVLQAVIG